MTGRGQPLKQAVKESIIVTVILAFGGANSQSYVCLFADEAHWIGYANYAGADTQFDTWVWWAPSARGLHTVTFRLTFPSNVIPGTITLNPNAQNLLGCNDGVEPYCATFLECQFDWVWSHRQACVLTDRVTSGILIANPLEATNCELGFPAEPVFVANGALTLNWWDAVEPETWGAIKSLYR